MSSLDHASSATVKVPVTVRVASVLLGLVAFVSLAAAFVMNFSRGTTAGYVEGAVFLAAGIVYVVCALRLSRGQRVVWATAATLAGAHLVFNVTRVAGGETESIAILAVLVAVEILLFVPATRRFMR